MGELTATITIPVSPLDDPLALPLLPPETVADFGATLVIAPHPDDESLGCGGAIALLADAGLPVRVLFVSDGTGSHVGSPTYPPERLRAVREAEALAALAHLGLAPDAATFLRLPDTAVPQEGHPDFAATASRLQTLLEAWSPTTILLPWRGEYHCDHVASWQLVRAAVAHLSTPPRLIEYPIWLWDRTMAHHLPDRTLVRGWRLDIGHVADRKLAAIHAHRSQTTDLISAAREAFQLDPHFLENFARGWEVFLEERSSG